MDVVLLHGLARTSRSMRSLSWALEAAGHRPISVDYPSRRAPLPRLAEFVADELRRAGVASGGDSVGFVCHSMGGVLWRALPLALPGFHCGRSVLIGSPVSGSLIAERLSEVRAVRPLFGPVLRDLAPARAATLPPPPGPFGAIAGDRATRLLPGTWLFSAWAKGRPSDSTVLVDETRSPHAADHLVLNRVHSLLPGDSEVRRQVLAFLSTGAFAR